MQCDFSSGWLELHSLLTSLQFSNSMQSPVQHGLLVAAISPSLIGILPYLYEFSHEEPPTHISGALPPLFWNSVLLPPCPVTSASLGCDPFLHCSGHCTPRPALPVAWTGEQ